MADGSNIWRGRKEAHQIDLKLHTALSCRSTDKFIAMIFSFGQNLSIIYLKTMKNFPKSFKSLCMFCVTVVCFFASIVNR